MKEIKGQTFLKIHSTSDAVDELDYVTSPRLNILNCIEYMRQTIDAGYKYIPVKGEYTVETTKHLDRTDIKSRI